MIVVKPKSETSTVSDEVAVPSHPYPTGFIFQSPGSQFTYRVIGPCCRLFDRDQLPWPCCRLQWRGKEPSWRRIGRRLIVDLSTKRYPSYSVELVGYSKPMQPIILTLYTHRLSAVDQNWWHTKRVQTLSTELSGNLGDVMNHCQHI